MLNNIIHNLAAILIFGAISKKFIRKLNSILFFKILQAKFAYTWKILSSSYPPLLLVIS